MNSNLMEHLFASIVQMIKQHLRCQLNNVASAQLETTSKREFTYPPLKLSLQNTTLQLTVQHLTLTRKKLNVYNLMVFKQNICLD